MLVGRAEDEDVVVVGAIGEVKEVTVLRLDPADGQDFVQVVEVDFAFLAGFGSRVEGDHLDLSVLRADQVLRRAEAEHVGDFESSEIYLLDCVQVTIVKHHDFAFRGEEIDDL